MTSFSDLQLEEIYSKLHDEHQCVTAKYVSLSFGVSRLVASEMLSALLHFHNERSCCYEVTSYDFNKTDDGKNTTRLRKARVEINGNSTLWKDDNRSQVKSTIFSLAVLSKDNETESAPSVKSGHECAMALLRDALHNASLGHAEDPSVLDPSLMCTIPTAHPVQKLDRVVSRNLRLDNSSGKMVEKMKSGAGKSTVTTSSSSQKKKTTTAASFFGTTSKRSATTSSGASKPVKTSTKLSSKTRRHVEDTKTTIDSSSTSKKVTKRPSAKPTQSKSYENVKKGNADDFVGDEDEDEDFLREEEERKKRNAANAKKEMQHVAKQESRIEATRRNQKRAVTSDLDDEDLTEKPSKSKKSKKKEHVSTGAIDSFTVVSNNKDLSGASNETINGTGKKRKRILEDRTYEDENGYFRTEKVPVWVDVSDTEENQTSATSNSVKGNGSGNSITKPKKKVKDTKKMKQQGLKGFFVAKKK